MREIALVLTLFTLGGCAAPYQPCAAQGGCSTGTICEIGRCVAHDVLPAKTSDRRVLLEPSSLAVIDDRRTHGASAIAFDGATPSPTLLVTYAIPEGTIDAAFLVLSPAEDEGPGAGSVELHVHPVLEPWTRDAEVSRVPPRVAPSRGAATATPGRVVRVDVTSLARSLRDPGVHGFAIVAASGDGPVRIATGLAGGAAPRLDVYFTAATK